ncbi:hypothetical protein PRVXT_002638 [Proteinivorax tanatarense]|uniref:Phosphoglyceromutase n=1 Tax=Proteinivorax tanatarense TaxID=1260629 RepID=A0AAU7VKK0_9FIRM
MKRIAFIVLLMFLLVNFTALDVVAENKNVPKTYVVIIDRVSPEQLEEYAGENLSYILENSSWGIMANNTASGRSSINNALTIGASSRAVGAQGELFFNSQEKKDEMLASSLYLTFNPGVSVPVDGVVNPFINHVKHQNDELMHPVKVGALGEKLKKHHLVPLVVGNSDSIEQQRHAAWIVADNAGQVPIGKVDENILIDTQKFVGGKKTDYNRMVNYLDQHQNSADIYLIDTGDTYRLDEHYFNYTQQTVENLTKDSIQRMDPLFEYILSKFNEDDNILILTFNVPRWRQEEYNEFIPTIYHYNQGGEAGLLTSGSTKRPGVVTSLDIAPTLLSFYDIKADNMFGQVATAKSQAEQKEEVMSMVKRINTVYSQRPFLVHFYVTLIMILVIFIMLNFKIKAIKLELLLLPILTLLWGPLAFLIMAFLPVAPIYISTVIFILISIILAYTTTIVYNEPINRLVFTATATVVVVIIDTFLDNFLQKQSVLGYDVIGGARFYGIGNEYIGVLLGGTILATYPLYKKQKSFWLYIIYSGVLFVTMAPFWGTNFGGTLALAVGFAMVLVDYNRKKGLLKTLATIGAAGLIILMLLIFFNITSSNPTHIGNLFAGENVIEDVIMTASRKLSMNFKLIQYSIWSRVFFVLLIAIIFLGFYPPQKLLYHKEKKYYLAIRGILAGSFTALLLNDSGIVTAAISMLFLTLPILYCLCSEKLPFKQ